MCLNGPHEDTWRCSAQRLGGPFILCHCEHYDRFDPNGLPFVRQPDDPLPPERFRGIHRRSSCSLAVSELPGPGQPGTSKPTAGLVDDWEAIQTPWRIAGAPRNGASSDPGVRDLGRTHYRPKPRGRCHGEATQSPIGAVSLRALRPTPGIGRSDRDIAPSQASNITAPGPRCRCCRRFAGLSVGSVVRNLHSRFGT